MTGIGLNNHDSIFNELFFYLDYLQDNGMHGIALEFARQSKYLQSEHEILKGGGKVIWVKKPRPMIEIFDEFTKIEEKGIIVSIVMSLFLLTDFAL